MTDDDRFRPGRRRFILQALRANTVFALLASGVCMHSLAQAGIPTAEYKLKAVIVYKFASYVEWPPEVFEQPDSPVVIGVAGADELADELAQVVSGRTVGDRRIVVSRIGRPSSLAGLHMLFIGGPTGALTGRLLGSVKSKPVLTVTEFDDALAHGSIINLVVDNDRVRFDIAPRQAELAGLKISSRLLPVARKIIGGAP